MPDVFGCHAPAVQRTAYDGGCDAAGRNAFPRAEHKRRSPRIETCGRANYVLGYDGDNRKDCGALLAARALIRNIVLERKPTAPRKSCNDEVPSVGFREIQLLCPGLLHGRNSLPNTLSKTGLAKIFNFVCDLLETPILSTPTLTKRHPFPHLSTQIEKYEAETWRAVFAIDELCEEFEI